MAKATKKKTIKLSSGRLYVKTTQNNTIISLTDLQGNKILGGWTGLLWYKGAKKETPYAAEMLAKNLLKEAQGFGLTEIEVYLRGTWMARDGVFKAINEIGLIDIAFIKECTPIQFGGVKGKRPRRN